MLAGVLHGVRDVRAEQRPDPQEPREGEVKIRVRAVGLCGSDLHYYREGRIADAVIRKPTVLGHEPAGEVVAVGKGVERLRPGDRVAFEPGIPCMECEYCAGGRPNLCPNVLFQGGPDLDGTFCEQIVWPEWLVEKMPDEMSFEEGAMLEPLGVALHALDLAGLRPGETVAVLGVGSVGMCAIELARASGATTIVASEPVAHRREFAVEIGSDLVFDPNEKGWEQEAKKALGGGADLTVECAGSAEAIASIGAVTKRGRRAVIVGIPAEDTATVSPHLWRRGELTIHNCRRSNQALRRCVEIVRSGRANVKRMVSHSFALSDVKEAFRIADERSEKCLKIVVTP